MLRYYSGIGARAAPLEVLSLMTRAAFALTKRGYVLRSGHAIGADSAFERGASRDAQIFLPVAGWRGSASSLHPEALGAELWRRARDIAAAHHPAFTGLRPGASHAQRLPVARAVARVPFGIRAVLDRRRRSIGRHRPGAPHRCNIRRTCLQFPAEPRARSR
jgi:hypothetical protein